MDKFEQEALMTKRLLAKSTWYHWLINYIIIYKQHFHKQNQAEMDKILSKD